MLLVRGGRGERMRAILIPFPQGDKRTGRKMKEMVRGRGRKGKEGKGRMGKEGKENRGIRESARKQQRGRRAP